MLPVTIYPVHTVKLHYKRIRIRRAVIMMLSAGCIKNIKLNKNYAVVDKKHVKGVITVETPVKKHVINIEDVWRRSLPCGSEQHNAYAIKNSSTA